VKAVEAIRVRRGIEPVRSKTNGSVESSGVLYSVSLSCGSNPNKWTATFLSVKYSVSDP
jgi:hypothetical protein